MTTVNIKLPLADALRVMNVLMAETDAHFLNTNRAATEDHKRTITVEQDMYGQIYNQATVGDITRAKRELSPHERKECYL